MADNFGIKLGKGGFGAAYSGKIIASAGKEVAVKRLSSGSHQGSTDFLNELVSGSKQLWLASFLLATQFCACFLPIAFAQTNTDQSSNDASKSISQVTIAIIVVSVLSVVLGGGGIIYCLYIFDKKTPHGLTIPTITIGTSTPQSTGSYTTAAPILPNSTLYEKQFTFAEVRSMTDNFGIKLGEGGFGSVYYGKITSTGKEVAVKRLSSGSHQGTPEFLNEVEILLRVHHRNLVSLIGYCQEVNERILIYEYMPEGTLNDHLHGVKSARTPLDWVTRIGIAVDAANGLKYLHADCNPKIIHRDIKSSNILLDEKLTGKVADFGLSKLVPEQAHTYVSTGVKGTFGYLDPEYAGLERLNEKSDVYSFGIVLLELLCGRKHVFEVSNSSDYQNISDWARPYLLNDKVSKIVDKSLREDFNVEALNLVARTALSCVERRSVARPSITEVFQQLKVALDIELKERTPITSTKDIDFSSQSDIQGPHQSQPLLRSTIPLLWDQDTLQHHQLPTYHSN